MTRYTRFAQCLSFLLAFFWLTAATTVARGDQALQDGLGRLAEKVEVFLRKEAQSSINVGDFIAPPRLLASGGQGLRHQLAELLQLRGIQARQDARFQLLGRFTLRDEREFSEAPHTSTVLHIRAEVLDEADETQQIFSISVFGESALELGGVTVDLSDERFPQDQQQEISDRTSNPHAVLLGDQTRAEKGSPFGVEVLVRHRGGALPRAPQLVDGRSFVQLEKGEEYIVRLHNDASFETAVTLSIDGLNMFTFSDVEGKHERKVLVPPGGFVDVPGWFLTTEHSEAFVITSYPDSAAGSLGLTSGIGTITARFVACWKEGDAPPPGEFFAKSARSLGTGRGRQIDRQYVVVQRNFGRVRAVVSVRYSR